MSKIPFNSLFLDEKVDLAFLYKQAKSNSYVIGLKSIIDVANFNKLNTLLKNRNFQTLPSFYSFLNQQEIKYKIADPSKDRSLINSNNYPGKFVKGYENEE